MKLIIKPKEEKEISIILPTSLLKSKSIWMMISKDSANVSKIFSKIYKMLKKYVRENGHFELLNIESKDAEIKIII